jgi:hypothetical protein
MASLFTSIQRAMASRRSMLSCGIEPSARGPMLSSRLPPLLAMSESIWMRRCELFQFWSFFL